MQSTLEYTLPRNSVLTRALTANLKLFYLHKLARLMQNCMNGINTGGAVQIWMSKIYSVNEVIFKMGIFPCTKLHFQQEGCMRKPPAWAWVVTSHGFSTNLYFLLFTWVLILSESQQPPCPLLPRRPQSQLQPTKNSSLCFCNLFLTRSSWKFSSRFKFLIWLVN